MMGAGGGVAVADVLGEFAAAVEADADGARGGADGAVAGDAAAG